MAIRMEFPNTTAEMKELMCIINNVPGLCNVNSEDLHKLFELATTYTLCGSCINKVDFGGKKPTQQKKTNQQKNSHCRG